MQGIEFVQDLAVVVLVAGLVGWVCQRLHLSVVVGYLAAGMVVGPYTPPFSLVHDRDRIETLAQVGLIFLVFSIGMRLSLRRLRQFGLGLVIATALGAVFVFNLTRLAGTLLGFNPIESFFLASMLMVSSSAVISKVLLELGAMHEKTGQLATGMTVLEDMVAVAMLTLLSSFIQFGRTGVARLGESLGLLGAFVVLAGIVGLLLVPWLLRRLSATAAEELQTVTTAGLLLGLALLARQAGYSLALGAFLLGAIVAETPHRHQVDRAFEGLRDVFSAVFFVAIGMEIDVTELVRNAGVIVAVAALAVGGRAAGCALGLLATGSGTREALQVGLTMTPIGEFSFIIAQLGVSAAVVPERFYPVAVGVSLLTTLAAAPLTRRAEGISAWLVAHEPRLLANWIDYYQHLLQQLRWRARRSRLWQLSKRRFVQIGVEVLFVTGLLVFSEQLFAMAEGYLGRDWHSPRALEIGFWSALVLLALAPLVAIWRNLSALALLYAEVATAGQRRAATLRPLVETGLKTLAGVGLSLWLSAVVPLGGVTRWLLTFLALLAVAALAIFWRKLIYWHSELEVGLHEALAETDLRGTASTAPWLRAQGDWTLNIVECVVPDQAACRGRTLADLGLRSRCGCSVVGIERQGYMIANPPPEAAFYPRDRVLLLGSAAQVKAAKQLLTAIAGSEPAAAPFDDVRMEAVVIPAASPGAGATLAGLAALRHTGVQVAGISRGGRQILNPGADETLRAGDEVLLLGTPEQVDAFRAFVRGEA